MAMMHSPVPTARAVADPVAPGAPARELHRDPVQVCFEAFKLQNNGNPMPTEMRPSIELVKMITEYLKQDPPTIPRAAKMKDSMGAAEPPPRFRLIRDANEMGMAIAIAMAPEMGVGHLEHLINSTPGDEINAKVVGGIAYIRVGAKLFPITAFFAGAATHVEDNQADNRQSQEFYVKLFDTSIRKLLENRRCSFTLITEEIGARGFDDLPLKRLVKGKGEGRGGGRVGGGASASRGNGVSFSKKYRGNSDSDDDSDDDKKKKKPKKSRSDRDKSKSKGKDSKKKKKGKSKESSDDSDSSGDDSEDSARGGSVSSVLPCYPYMYDKKGCREKHCEYSHRATVIKKYEDGKGKKKKAKTDDDE